MSTPKHTPGPWSVGIHAEYKHVVFANGVPVATAEQNHEANARLIAASPELLEACKGLNGLHIDRCQRCDGTGKREYGLNLDEACHECGGVGEIVDGHFHPDELRAIRSAIEKATKGEAE